MYGCDVIKATLVPMPTKYGWDSFFSFLTIHILPVAQGSFTYCEGRQGWSVLDQIGFLWLMCFYPFLLEVVKFIFLQR